MSVLLGRAPLAALAALALAASALAAADPPAGAIAALCAAALAARRAPAAAALCAIFAFRLFLPDPALSLPSTPREAMAAPLLRLIPEPDADVAVGSLLGGRSALPRDVADAFNRTGTAHLLAVSGFNITLASSALGLALRPLGARAGAAGTVFAALAFTWLAGFGPSVLRAAAMSAVAGCGLLLGRDAPALNALGAAVVALLFVSPRAIGDVGFLLSVSATAGLVLFAAPLERRLPGPRWLRAQLATTLAASAASAPVAAEAFGRVPLLSPLVNLAVAPLVAPLMTVTGAGLVAGQLTESAALPFALAAYACARALRAIVEVSARLPLVSVMLPHGGAVLAAAYALAGGLAWARTRDIRPRLPNGTGVAIGALAMLAFLVAAVVRVAPADAPRVLALDVGQGDAFLVDAGGARLLVDGGPDPKRTLAALGDVLAPLDRRIDVVALTHAHVDHASGLAAVLERYEVGLALEPNGLDVGPVADAWHEAVARRGVPLRAVRRGDRVRVAGLTVEVLAPLGDPADPLANLALRVSAGALTVLFLGDATERGQADLLLRSEELATVVYVPPHHGAATPLADALVAAARPRVALLSVGAGNRYGHPAPPTLRALANVRTLRTDRDGTLEVSADGHGIECETRPSALSRLWTRWLPRPPPCA